MSVAQNFAKAKLDKLRSSPQKTNLVLQLIRGKHVSEAMEILEGCQKRISKDIAKLLNSAVANAENNNGLDIDSLYVSEAIVGKSIVMKRFRARARGRGARILKPFSNVRITVTEREV